MSNKEIIRLLLILIVLFIAFFCVILFFYYKQIKKRNSYSIFISTKKIRVNYLYVMYTFFSQWSFTIRYINRIKKDYDISYPGDEKKSINSTMKLVLFTWIIAILAIFFVLIVRLDFYTGTVLLIVGYIMDNEIHFNIAERREVKLLKQLDNYLGDVRHAYFDHSMVDEAIYETLYKAEYEMKLHGSKIYDILTSETMEEDLDLYNDTIPNRFLKTFLAICVTTIQFGDQIIEKQSLFLNNVKDLKREISIEIRKREKINFLFLGLTITTVAPLFFLPTIEKWGVSNISELTNYYKGTYGSLVMILLFILTLFIYNVLKNMKETMFYKEKDYLILKKLSLIPVVNQFLENYINSNYGRSLRLKELLKRTGDGINIKQFYLKQILIAIAILLGSISVFLTIHENNKTRELYDVKLVDLTSSASPKEQETIKKIIVKYTYLNKNIKDITVLDLTNKIMEEKIVQNKEIITLVAKEIQTRIKNYQFEYFKWYELIICILASFIGFKMPLWILYYHKKLLEMQMEDEVIQFQSIILMLIYMNQINTETLLEWMFNFSNIFKSSIQECLNNLSSGDYYALEKLKEREPFEPFVRIVENLQSCDRIPIDQAFNEIAVDRINYQEKRKQDYDIYIKNKGMLAQFISMITIYYTLVFYLIIPFIMEGMIQFIAFSEQMI